LKHMVKDKQHYRSYGNVQLLNQQPCAGRSRDGGLKFGEMERDCMLGHGTSAFLKERLFDMSDPYQMVVCSKCGTMVNSNTKCNMCGSMENMKVNIPYASKLLFQQLQALALKVSIE